MKMKLALAALMMTCVSMASVSKADSQSNANLEKRVERLENLLERALTRIGKLDKRLSNLEGGSTLEESNGAEQCDLNFNNGWYKIQKNGSDLSTSSTDLSAVLANLGKMQDAGVCSNIVQNSDVACELNYNNGWYKIKKNGSDLSSSTVDQDATLELMKNFRRLHICR